MLFFKLLNLVRLIRAVPTEGHPLPDQHWHMTEYISNIQTKAKTLDPSVDGCNEIKQFMPERVCTTPMKARTEFTPRAHPKKTSLTTIMKATPDGYIPRFEEKNLYTGPDVNPNLDVPEGEIDVRTIVSNRRKLSEEEHDPFHKAADEQGFDADATLNALKKDDSNMDFKLLRHRRVGEEEIKAGKGWEIDTLPGQCDGSYHAHCNRGKANDCLLSGHHDHRGGIIGNELSGWFVVNVPDVKAGIIIIKFEDWLVPDDNKVTKGWTKVNDGDYERERHRILQNKRVPLPEEFVFEYAINGKVTSLTKDSYYETIRVAQRTMEIVTVLDDPAVTGEVEVGIRLRNCGRGCVFKMTHIYWG